MSPRDRRRRAARLRREYRKANVPRAHLETRCWCGHTASLEVPYWSRDLRVDGPWLRVFLPVCRAHTRPTQWPPEIRDQAGELALAFGHRHDPPSDLVRSLAFVFDPPAGLPN